MKINEFYTINSNKEVEIIEKKSRFIANIYSVENTNIVEDRLKMIKKKYYNAKHHCYAYRIIDGDNIMEKASDDGEPSGTAGSPLLSVLKKNNLCNVIIIVTRYFGGILLGTGGLVRAYTDSAIKCINESNIIKKIDGFNISVRTEYSNLEIFKHYCKKNDINIKEIKYEETIFLQIEMEKNRKKYFETDLENKKVKKIDIIAVESKYINKNVVKNK